MGGGLVGGVRWEEGKRVEYRQGVGGREGGVRQV